MTRSLVVLLVLASVLVWPAKLVASPGTAVAPLAVAVQSGTSPNEFADAQYYQKLPNEKKAKTIDGKCVLDGGAKAVRFVSKGGTVLDVPYGSITSMLYERTATPRYAAAILLSVFFIFSKSKKHFLTIQYKGADGQGQFAIIRFDKKNYQAALAAVEAQTGIKIDRTEEK